MTLPIVDIMGLHAVTIISVTSEAMSLMLQGLQSFRLGPVQMLPLKFLLRGSALAWPTLVDRVPWTPATPQSPTLIRGLYSPLETSVKSDSSQLQH